MTHPTWELPVAENSAGLVLTPCPGTKDLPLVEINLAAEFLRKQKQNEKAQQNLEAETKYLDIQKHLLEFLNHLQCIWVWYPKFR